MTKARVPIADALRMGQKTVVVEHGSTNGATIGENLFMLDDNGDPVVVTPEQILNRYVTQGGGGGGSNTGDYAITAWRLIAEIPNNIVELAKLTGQGFAFRNADGTWRLRRVGRQVINFAYGDPPSDVYTAEVNRLLVTARIRIDTPFDGVGAGVSFGTSGDPEFYIAQSDVDPYTAAGYETTPDEVILMNADARLTITPGTGATTGFGRLIIDTVPLEGI